MNIYVCMKQVPNTTEVRIDKEKGTLIRDNVDNIINPADKNALEEALKIKEKTKNTKITVITMGPEHAMTILNEALAMGADKGVLISDKKFSGSDTYVTSYILAETIKKLGLPDLILAGKQAIDGETAQVGLQLAEKLSLEFETSVEKVELHEEYLKIIKETEEKKVEIRIKMPCLLTINKNCNEPRTMNLYDIVNLNSKDIHLYNAEKLNISEDKCGLKASPTKVIKTYIPRKNNECIFLETGYEKKIIELIKNI